MAASLGAYRRSIVSGLQAKLENVLRAREVAQLARPKIGKHDVVGQCVDDQLGGRARAQDLAARGQCPQAGGAVDRATEVVAVAKLDLAGMQRHADAHGLTQRPRLMGDGVLQLDGGCGGRRRTVEDRERGIAFAARLDQPASARCHDLFDELVVARERHRHGVGIRLPGCRRPLNVGEEEGDCPRYGRDMLCHRHIQRGILRNDGGLEPPKVRPRIDPQLVGQKRPCPLISAKGFALPACAVEGEHQLAPSPLAKWCVGDRGFEFADDLRGTARREQRICSVFHQRGVSLVPARLLRRALVGCRAVRESRARGSAPLRSGPPLGSCRRWRRRRGPVGGRLVTRRVHLRPGQGPARALGQHDAVVQHATQRGDVGL